MRTEQEPGRELSREQTFARLAREWTRQTYAYTRSLRAYQERSSGRYVRVSRIDRVTCAWSSPTAVEPMRLPVPVASDDGEITPAPPSPGTRVPLTGRQLEIARLIAAGLSNDAIARQLVLTPGTVGNHIGHILRRLGARNRAQVAAWVTQMDAGTASGDERAS
jgi:DNA-binding NarL/FixJ family response regulator